MLVLKTKLHLFCNYISVEIKYDLCSDTISGSTEGHNFWCLLSSAEIWCGVECLFCVACDTACSTFSRLGRLFWSIFQLTYIRPLFKWEIFCILSSDILPFLYIISRGFKLLVAVSHATYLTHSVIGTVALFIFYVSPFVAVSFVTSIVIYYRRTCTWWW